MTRDFNTQRRGDTRPSARRGSSEGRYEGERSTRPARPRLNRAMVDRAWEEGAQTTHADYRPRTRGQAQPTDYRSNRQQHGHPSQSNGANDRRPYANRQPREPYGYGDPQNNHQGHYERNGNNRYSSDSRERPGSSQEQRPYNRYPNQERPYRGNGSYQRSSYDSGRSDRAPRDYGRGNAERRDYDAPRGPRNAPIRNGGERYRQPQRYESTYEGDYERFNNDNDLYPSNRPPARQGRNGYRDRRPTAEPRERHVTRLPDGRVLKGSRPAQRRQAEYWTEVEQNSDELLQQIQAPTPEETNEQAEQAGSEPKRHTPIKEDAPRARKPLVKKERTSGSQSGRTTRAKQAGEGKARSSGPKPSQRGFKWPSSDPH